jgi:hypothetical protein
LYGKIFLTLYVTGLCPEKFSEKFFSKNIENKGKIVARKKICCRAPSVLAGQFWQTPPELEGASFAPVRTQVWSFRTQAWSFN